jgi:hypothetical protein
LSKDSFACGFEAIEEDTLKNCKIPVSYSSNKAALRTAIEFFTQYDYAYNGFVNKSDKLLFNQLVDCICDLSENHSILNAVNKKIQLHGDLYSWVVLVMDEWKDVTSKTKIRSITPYMKKCLIDWLNSTEIEIKDCSEELIYGGSGNGKVRSIEKPIIKEQSPVLSSDYIKNLMNFGDDSNG